MSTERTKLVIGTHNSTDDIQSGPQLAGGSSYSVEDGNNKATHASLGDEGKVHPTSLTFLYCQLISILAICIPVIIVLVVMVIILFGLTGYCSSKSCALQAGLQTAIMDADANPCQDFYRYACGNWDQVYPTKPGIGKYSGFYRGTEKIEKRLYNLLSSDGHKIRNKTSSGVKKVKDFFHGCSDIKERNKAGIAPLIKLIKEVGGWTFHSSKDWNSGSWSFFNSLDKIHSLGEVPFFHMGLLSIDSQDSSRYIVAFGAPDFFFSRPEMLNSDPKFKSAFMQYAKKLAELLKAQDKTRGSKIAAEIWGIEQTLAKNSMSLLKSRKPQNTNIKVTLRKLQDTVFKNSLDIVKFVKKKLGHGITENTVVKVGDMEYMKFLGGYLGSLKDETKANYMVFKLVELYAMKLTDAFQELSYAKQRVLNGLAMTPPVWKTCVSLTENLLPIVTSAIYADQHWDSTISNSVTSLEHNIKASMKETIKNSKWMDKSSKKEALKKVDRILPSIGYPDFIFDVARLDEELKDVSIDKSSFFESYKRIHLFSEKDAARRFHKPVDRRRFTMSPVAVNAYYSQEIVGIKILGGILQYPFFDTTFSSAFKYGALGSIIGHEMTHGFDSRGRLYDSRGVIRDWWTANTTRNYGKLEKCFIDQYSKETFFGIKNRGAYTLAENIADNGGVQVSYRAYEKFKAKQGIVTHSKIPGLNLSGDQMFFLSFAQVYCGHYTPQFAKHLMQTDVHSVFPHRVMVTLSNMPEFAIAYRCNMGDRYNPKKRCQLW